MSLLLVNEYLKQLSIIKKTSVSHNETIVREAFKDLLKAWGKQQELVFLAEYPLKTATKSNISLDGALLHELRMPMGYWEAKDADDNLDEEVTKKFSKGYPQDNILFTDDITAILIQNRNETSRCDMTNPQALAKLLVLFFSYERPEIANFRIAINQFKQDLPAVIHSLREMILVQEISNLDYQQASKQFLEHAQQAINPILTDADVREMLIQHILTEEIFANVFNDSDFHRENNIAKELYALENSFFKGNLKKQTLKSIEPYYVAIRANAAQISSHSEKQRFLKIIYENFYKVYNPKAADRLGVVYTPNEIVKFMIEGADWLCEKHFQKNLIDEGVDILDPATGTGTFICELIEHFRGQPQKLAHKYQHELHANEVAILPYYVANLNIEATYAAITDQYLEFPSLCFVDTLDNVGAHTASKGSTNDLFGSVSEENVARIKRQNEKHISVIIGNPPYNANQMSENDNNKNRIYPNIDQRIKATYIEQSTAQKTKLYDMYARFFRWASDRLSDNGVLAFVTNNSFINAKTFDGFRKTLAEEFNEIWIVDLKGNARNSGEQRRKEGGNIFDNQIKVGIAISFCIKKSGASGCKIMYEAVRDYAKSEEKLSFVAHKHLNQRNFEIIHPDKNGNWLNITHNDFDSFIPIANKETKAAKSQVEECAIFKLYSLGMSTNRDEWVYDDSKDTLAQKMRFFIEHYQQQKQEQAFDEAIKWSEALKLKLSAGRKEKFTTKKIQSALYRPFSKRWLYNSDLLIDRKGAADEMQNSPRICFSGSGSSKPFHTLVTSANFGLDTLEKTQGLPLYRYDTQGNQSDNITDWGLAQFFNHYHDDKITKKSIFSYCYAVLHDPIYRDKYAQNLKREFPRIPLYADFWQWQNWGEQLLALHIDYETISSYPLKRTDTPDIKARAAGMPPKALLKADKAEGIIALDSETSLSGIPAQAWDYKLGNRSALEWILDQHKESKSKDATIREHFNTYKFSDYKKQIIELIGKITAVSMQTLAIIDAMKILKRNNDE